MKVNLIVDEIVTNDDKNIAIRLSGEDLAFQASTYSLSLYIDENLADKISFQLQTILQDRERTKKDEQNA